MKSILLLGKNGQLGWELHRSLSPLGPVHALDYPQIDLGQPDNLRKMILKIRPQVIVNAAAYTAVDQAEQEPETAMAINGYAPGVLAEIAKSLGAALIHYSTDYVFDGSKGAPYIETDAPNPLNAYGRSKLQGEQAVAQVDAPYLILRTSWVYSLRRDCFVTKVLRMARQQESLHIVTDQVGSPTWARMLAETTALVLARASASMDFIGWIRERRGIYHLVGKGYTTRFKWAQAILEFDPNPHEQISTDVFPSSSSEFPSGVRRPSWSALNCDHIIRSFDFHIPNWEESLELALEK